MLAKDGNGTPDFKNGNEDGWPCDGKSDQQRYQLYKTQTNGFGTIRFVQMTTVGHCDLNEHEDSKKSEETTSNGNTNVFNQRRTSITTASKAIVAVIVRALATQERTIDVGGVASCGAVATFAVGQINLVFQELAHQGRVFPTQTSTGKGTMFKGSIVVVAPRPTKFR
jgi:hypothetical protein